MPFAQKLVSARLSAATPFRFRLEADAGALSGIARALELLSVDALNFQGTLTPRGRMGFDLSARLTARVTQACVVTLVPVPAVVDTEVTRMWRADVEEPQGDEIEVAADDGPERTPAEIDLGAVATEALALALPDYPRAPGAGLPERGTAPAGPEDRPNPFAVLKALKPKDDGAI